MLRACQVAGGGTSHWYVQIRQLFGFCGGVIGVDRVGEQKQFLFVEYTYPSVQLVLLQILSILPKCISPGTGFMSLSGALARGFDRYRVSCSANMTLHGISAW